MEKRRETSGNIQTKCSFLGDYWFRVPTRLDYEWLSWPWISKKTLLCLGWPSRVRIGRKGMCHYAFFPCAFLSQSSRAAFTRPFSSSLFLRVNGMHHHPFFRWIFLKEFPFGGNSRNRPRRNKSNGSFSPLLPHFLALGDYFFRMRLFLSSFSGVLGPIFRLDFFCCERSQLVTTWGWQVVTNTQKYKGHQARKSVIKRSSQSRFVSTMPFRNVASDPDDALTHFLPRL